MYTNEELKAFAKNIRANIVREVYNAQSGHPGGSLGCTDILTTLYFYVMDVNQDNVDTVDRDRFVLSKGHCSPGLYATLSEKGFIPKEELLTYRMIDSKLQGHPNMNYVRGVDMSTGSLGQGFAVASGMAIANKLAKNDHRIYALLGDGECEEGEIWETAMSSAHYKLDNLCAIVDVNGLQIDGWTKDVVDPEPLDKKFEAFGWYVIKVDGHNFDELKAAFDKAKTIKGQPTCIIAKTVKGKGVSYMENDAEWHGKAPNKEQFEQAIKEIEGGF